MGIDSAWAFWMVSHVDVSTLQLFQQLIENLVAFWVYFWCVICMCTYVVQLCQMELQMFDYHWLSHSSGKFVYNVSMIMYLS